MLHYLNMHKSWLITKHLEQNKGATLVHRSALGSSSSIVTRCWRKLLSRKPIWASPSNRAWGLVSINLRDTAKPAMSMGNGRLGRQPVWKRTTFPSSTTGRSNFIPPTRPTGHTETRYVYRIWGWQEQEKVIDNDKKETPSVHMFIAKDYVQTTFWEGLWEGVWLHLHKRTSDTSVTPQYNRSTAPSGGLTRKLLNDLMFSFHCYSPKQYVRITLHNFSI